MCSTLHYCTVHAGVAVATAFCAIESPAVTSASEWTFGVTDTGISDFHYFSTRFHNLAHIFVSPYCLLHMPKLYI